MGEGQVGQRVRLWACEGGVGGENASFQMPQLSLTLRSTPNKRIWYIWGFFFPLSMGFYEGQNKSEYVPDLEK